MSEKVPISKMVGIKNASEAHRKSNLVKGGINYPVIFKHDWQSTIKSETKVKFDKMKEEFAKQHGETGKKLMQQDELYRSVKTRILFCESNDLKNVLGFYNGNKITPDWSIENEKVKFYEDQFHSPILMNVLYGEKIEYEDED